MPTYDSVVIGGGFYGCCIALYLRRSGRRVLLLEQASQLLQRASFVNQARIHQGYHYPRSIVTGLRSRANTRLFLKDFGVASDTSFTQLYAISNASSKVSANQFVQFCHRINAPVRPARDDLVRLFSPLMVEQVFEVEEGAFDAHGLRSRLQQALRRFEVDVRCDAPVARIGAGRGDGQVDVVLDTGECITAPQVWNCTYAFLNRLLYKSNMPLLPLKHEMTELCLIRPPPALQDLGVTVMDGPFFSTMPFPAESLHSLSHVRFTPRRAWAEGVGKPCRDPYALLTTDAQESWFYPMIKDASRYMPLLAASRHVRSLHEVKTVLVANEADDGRPILFRRDHGVPNHFVVLGGKIDNVYDFFAAAQSSGAIEETGAFDYAHEGLLPT